MVRVFTFASGKGGAGKTTATVNVGTCLAQFGKSTIIMDADIGMANLGLALGLEDAPVTLHEVLSGKANVHDAIYEGPAGVKVVPSGISLQGFQQANPELLRDVLKDLVNVCEFLLIDAPAGISRDGIRTPCCSGRCYLDCQPRIVIHRRCPQDEDTDRSHRWTCLRCRDQ